MLMNESLLTKDSTCIGIYEPTKVDARKPIMMTKVTAVQGF